MTEQFDKQLRDHIKDTFDVYDDLMEHDGWLKYQRKVRRKKYATVFLWSLPGSIAAALAFVWLLNIGIFNAEEQKIEIAGNKTAIPLEDINSNVPEIALAETSKVKDEIKQQADEVFTSADYTKALETARPFESVKSARNGSETIASTSNSNLLMSGNNSISPENNTEKLVSVVDKPEVKDQEAVKQSSFRQELLTNPIGDAKDALKGNGFNRTFSDLAMNANADLGEDKAKEKLGPKKLRVGLDASTFMNFTKDGLSQDMNLGVGIASELKISKNLSVSSGININKQSASYATSVESLPSSAKMVSSFADFGPLATPIVNESAYSAKFVGFDIPFALKYSSNNKNLNWFVSTGFSAYTILTETYSNNISTVNYGFSGIQTTNEVVTEELKEDPFSNLQLARTLNFSFGLTFPIKNVTSLSVEPFVKYPLRSFGREDLTIGSSGVSLKMNLDKRLFK